MAKPRIAVLAAAAALLVAGCTPSFESPDASAPADELHATASPTPEPESVEPATPAPPIDSSELDLYGGVATLSTSSTCTGTLIETGVDSAPAYILTNGHCVGMDARPANEIMVGEEGQGDVTFFNVLDAPEGSLLTIAVDQYEYGTMRGVDVGILQLDATLGELRGAGAVPLPITKTPPVAGTGVVNIAAPTEAVSPDELVLRKGECTLGESVDLIEHIWLWLDAPRTDCPGVLRGSSGSPLIADHEIKSIINTTNVGVTPERGAACFLGQPCEISGNEATFRVGTSYGVDIAGVGSCFPDGVFTLGGDCPLPAASLSGVSAGGIFGGSGVTVGGTPAEVTLEAGSPEDVVVVQLPIGDARACTSPDTYAGGTQLAAESTDEPATLPLTLRADNGFELVCAAVPGQEDRAARFVFSVDTFPPSAGPELAVQELGDGELMVNPLFYIPEISDIRVLIGPPEATDCSDRDAYQFYLRQPFFFSAEGLPVRFCAIGFDMAGNESPITDEILPRD